MEGRSAPPIDVRGGEAGTYGVADEQMLVRQRAPHMEQRSAPETLEIEGWSRRIAKSPLRQAVVEAAAAVKVAKEGDCIT
jgi:hypothetical protein